MTVSVGTQIEVKPVETAAERKQFLHLPWRIYRDDPNWVPPIRPLQRELVGYKPHPFYDHGSVQTFLALLGGEPVGRIAAIINEAHNQRHGERRGFFGFFECIDSEEAAAGLFDAARAWMAERGVRTLRGPVNPSLNYECGLLIDGFDSPPTFMMTYNRPYYARLIEACGFSKAQDLYSFIAPVSMLQTLEEKMWFVTEEARRRFNVVSRRLDKRRFTDDVRTFLHIYNESLGGTWGFSPMSEGEMEHMAASLRYLIVPEMTSFIEVEGRPVGACFGLLDYNPRIKKIDGRLFPFGFLRLLYKRRAIKRVRFLSTNVLPEYQRWGLGLVVLNRMIPDVLDWGMETAEFSWVLESNHLSCKTLQRSGVPIEKTHRIYDWEADR